MSLTLDTMKTLIIIVILSVLGLNVFIYLVRGTDILNSDILSMPKNLFNKTENTIEQSGGNVVDIIEKGSSKTKNIITKELDKIGNVLDIRLKHNEIMNNANNANSDINNDLDYPGKKNKKTGSQGYCYIGTDRDIRTCVNIGRNDTCMSGDIYPTIDICINPNLRM